MSDRIKIDKTAARVSPRLNGKGDVRRPGDVDAYRTGWDRIFGGGPQQDAGEDHHGEQ